MLQQIIIENPNGDSKTGCNGTKDGDLSKEHFYSPNQEDTGVVCKSKEEYIIDS